MLKQKISIAVALTLIGGNVMAAQSGFYAGGRLGYETGGVKYTQDVIVSGDTINSTYNNYLSDYTFGAYVGYDQFFSRQFVLGGEIFANRSNAKSEWKTNLAATNREFQKISTLGISVLPGWQLNDRNRLYARFGWAQAEFDQENNNPDAYGPAFHAKARSGVETGLGWMMQLSQKLALRLEYDHFNYNAFKTVYSTTDAHTLDGNYAYKSSFDQFTAGVSYYFSPNTPTNNTAQAIAIPHGLYVGGDVGRSSADLKVYETASNNTYDYNYNLQGYVRAGAHLGYRLAFTPTFSTALEVFANTDSNQMNYRNIDVSSIHEAKYREKDSFGLSVLPGYNITPDNLLYARLGIINSRFTKSSNTQETPDFSVGQHGTEVGAGYEIAIASHWSILGEYDHAMYAKINTYTHDGYKVSYSPEDNLYKLGFNYYF